MARRRKRSTARRPTSKRSSGRSSKKASDKVRQTMHEFKHGTLRSGSGRKVRTRKQAIAIGLAQARRAGAKVPPAREDSTP